MKVMMTGASGFVGRHLIRTLLTDSDIDIVAGIRHKDNDFLKLNVVTYVFDILQYESVYECINSEQPDMIIHLAAQSNVGVSWVETNDTVAINVMGTLNLYKAFSAVNPRGKFIHIGSGEEYGATVKVEMALNENMSCRPQNPYAISKYSTELLLLQLAKKEPLNVICTRSFNHFGPYQNLGFVISDFASQLAKIKLGLIPAQIFVGNLNVARDFLYIDDVISAYYGLIKNNIPNGVYNVSSGRAYKITDILAELIEISGTKPEVVIDKNKFRPVEVDSFFGSNTKICEVLSWRPSCTLKDGLEKTFKYWLEIGALK